MMPITMLVGGIFYNFFSQFSALIPYLIFSMLLFTFCGLSVRDIRFTKMHLWLVLIQIVGSTVIYVLISPYNEIVAQGLMICVLTPTASSAPVITGMLKGSVASSATYNLVSNLGVAITAPVFFSLIGKNPDMNFFESFLYIFLRMLAIIVLPFVLAQLTKQYLPKISKRIAATKSLTFYMWTFALTLATGKTVEFIFQQDSTNYLSEIIMAAGALVICLVQFFVGRKIGRKFNDTVAGGQGLGQKNTILAIWMVQTYLNPIAAIAPGAYILWQNIVNSYQVWRKRKEL